MTAPRQTTLITGAAGGMGRACARLFGGTDALILTDVAAPALDAFAHELTQEGHAVLDAAAGDLSDPVLLERLAGRLAGPFTLIHAAGLSPAMAGWRPILETNLLATERLLRAIEPRLEPGTVAVLIASMAGHLPLDLPGADALLADPLGADFPDRIGALIEAAAAGSPAGAGGIAYALSKRAVIRLAERLAPAWGARGARIVSISPGMILTPMGRRELAETPGAQQLTDAAPAGRAGTAADIALAAQFLASDRASFITGCDLKVDGGGAAVIRAMAE